MPTIEHLERALQIWEDAWYAKRMNAQLATLLGKADTYPLIGQIRHSAEFRDYLLRCRPGIAFDADRFMHGSVSPEGLGHLLAQLPMLLTAWTVSSRRVFHPDSDLQLLLQATSLKHVRFEDVRWPFQSFAVALERPLVHEGRPHSLLVVSNFGSPTDFKPKWLTMTAFHDGLLSYRPFTPNAKERLQKKLRHGDAIRCLDFHTSLADQWGAQIREIATPGYHCVLPWETIAGLEIDSFPDAYASSLLDPLGPVIAGFVVQMARIVVGICLYLTTLPSGNRTGSEWKPSVEPGRPGRAITSQAHVCDVASVHRLTPEERGLFERVIEGRVPGVLSPHFRSGHWRRPPGKGQDAEALKTVWVRPTLVKPDALPEAGLPVGATSKLSS